MTSASVAGLRYVQDYLDAKTHDELLACADARPWVATPTHRVQIYGYSYNHTLREARRVSDIPAWATTLAARLHDEGLMPSVPNQMVANEYAPGTGISRAHRSSRAGRGRRLDQPRVGL